MTARVIAVTAGADSLERRAEIPAAAERIALLAHWSVDVGQSRSVVELVSQLQRHGYWVVLSSTCEAPGRLEFTTHPGVDLARLTVIRRPNIGYDFGSWAVAMHHFPWLLRADKVLVLNDSLLGPFASISSIIASFESTTADVWGVVESDQFARHHQSFFRGFRYGALAESTMRSYWEDLQVIPSKSDLITTYELGFQNFLSKNYFSTDSMLHHRDLVRSGENPAAHGWLELLDAGVPFVKRELVWGKFKGVTPTYVAEEIQRRYHQDVFAWT